MQIALGGARSMKKVLFVILLAALFVVPGLAQNPIEGQYPSDKANPYYERAEPDYFGLLSSFMQLYATEFGIIRKQSINILDLPLLEIWCSEGVMYALYKHCPITSWDELKEIKYISATSSTGKPRAAISESKALTFLLFFDLAFGPEGWPWSN
jgi:hypothetical protein